MRNAVLTIVSAILAGAAIAAETAAAPGDLASTFGGSGKVTTKYSHLNEQAHAMKLQADGKVLVAGWADTGISGSVDFTIFRYTSNGVLDPDFHSDGVLDTTFGTTGKITTDIGSGTDDRANAAVLQPDGRVLVTGSSGNNFALARYLPVNFKLITSSLVEETISITQQAPVRLKP